MTCPSRQQFALDLGTLYYLSNSQPIQNPYLTHLVSTFANFYANQFKPKRKPNTAYYIFLKLCVECLTNFTDKVPSQLKTDPSRSLFLQSIALSRWDDVKKGAIVDPALIGALGALGSPFHTHRLELEDLGLFDWSDRRTRPWIDLEEPEHPGPYMSHVLHPDDRAEYRKEYDRKERDYEKAKKQYRKAEEEALEKMDHFEWSFVHTPLFPIGHHFLPPNDLQCPFELPTVKRFLGMWCIAPPGKGKTNLLLNMIFEDMKTDASVIVMDSKGDLSEPISRIQDDRLVVIDPLDRPAINPLDATHSVELLEYIFAALLETQLTPNQTALFRSVLTLLTKIPNATLVTFEEILREGWENHRQYVEQLASRDRAFFEKDFNTRTYSERKPEILLRLRLLMSNPHFEAMFSAPKTKVHIGDLMNQGKIIVIDNSKRKLGDGGEFFARLFVALILGEAQQRERNARPCFVYIDECQNVIRRDEKIATILDECRSKRIALILAHQRIGQIDSPNVRDALANCGIKLASPDADAKALAGPLETTEEELKGLPQGTFAAHIQGITRSAVRLSVPLAELPPQMNDGEYRAFKTSMRHLYSYQPEPAKPQRSANSDILQGLEHELGNYLRRDDPREWG